MANNQFTKAQVVMNLAEKHGEHHSNSWYKAQAKQDYDLDISASVISTVLGKHNDRLAGSLSRIRSAAKRLLETSQYDLGLCVRLLRQVAQND